ncbi:MAG: hypothetical protein Fur0010_06290 [Bdellovibrio sp.]
MAKIDWSDKVLKKSYVFFSMMTLSGILVWIFKEFFSIQTEWGEEPHPLISYFRFVHHFMSIIFIWFLGAISLTHVTRFIQTHHKSLKRSGWALLTVSLLSIFSGMILYHINNQAWLTVVELFHVICGFTLSAVFLLHRYYKKS